MSRNPGEELPPITKEIDGAVFRRLRLDIEGAPMHQFLSPAAAERAMRAARIRHHGTAGKYWIHVKNSAETPSFRSGRKRVVTSIHFSRMMSNI